MEKRNGWVGRREVENRLSGERIVIKTSSAESGGASMVFDLYLKPGGGVEFSHYHAIRSEILRMKRGELLITLGNGETKRLRAGDELELPPGTVHSLVNDTPEEVYFEGEYRPGLGSDEWFMKVHAAEDQLGRNLTLIELAPHLSEEVDTYPAKPSRWVVRVTVAMLAVISRMIGKDRVILEAADAWHRARGSSPELNALDLAR